MLVVHSGHVLEFVVFRMRFLSSLTFVVPLCVAHVRSTLPFSPVMFHLGVLLLYGVNCGVTFNYVPLSLILLNSVCACGGCSPPARGGFLEASTKSKAIGGCRALRGDIYSTRKWCDRRMCFVCGCERLCQPQTRIYFFMNCDLFTSVMHLYILLIKFYSIRGIGTNTQHGYRMESGCWVCVKERDRER